MDRMFLPHSVQQHHHLDAAIDGDGDVRVLHDGDAHTEMRKMRVSAGSRQVGGWGWGYLSCVISAVDAQVKERLFLPALTSMPAVLAVTPISSGWW